MSGYLEVKYPFKSNLGLNPFKSWKRQWCILRPSPTCSGGSLAVYCSEAGAAAGTVELGAGCVVRRATSRTRPHAFAVFSADEPRKPRVLLAAHSHHDAHSWMEKIRALLNGDKLLGTEALLKDSYSVTVIPTGLARKCGVSGAACVLTLSSTGLLVSRPHQLGTFLLWKHIGDVHVISESDRRICVVTVDSEFPHGCGELKFSTPLGAELAGALRRARQERGAARAAHLSRSDGDLRAHTHTDLGEVRRSSWYSEPSEVSLDDIDLVMSKDSKRIPSGQLSRCSGEGDLAPAGGAAHSAVSFDDSMCDRRSLVSVASGIYEEIPDLPAAPHAPHAPHALYCHMGQAVTEGVSADRGGLSAAARAEEPTYESVAECMSGRARCGAATNPRGPPPPLPPRLPLGSTAKLCESWNSRVGSARCEGGEPSGCAGGGVARHGSLGSLTRCCGAGVGAGAGPGSASTLPTKGRQAFSVFRKRLKSDSRILSSPKSDSCKESKLVEPKKKRFDFPPPRDIFKSFKVGRKGKARSGNAGAGALGAKGETKSCEFLDETEHVTANRCSKSVECLEDNSGYLDEFDGDLSIEFNDEAVAALALPQEIVDLILRGRHQLAAARLGGPRAAGAEGDYMAMSPVAPPPPAPLEHHYIVMSPKTNLA